METVRDNLVDLSDGVHARDERMIARVVRQLPSLRKKITAEILAEFISLPSLPTIEISPAPMQEIEKRSWILLLVVVYFLDKKDLVNALVLSQELMGLVKTISGGPLSVLKAKSIYYYAVVCEKSGSFPDQYSEFLALYRTACLQRDGFSQATLMNILLRILTLSSMYDQAFKLVSKTSFPEIRSNSEYARYLYYTGKLKAIRLEYSESHNRLSQAYRKAPQSSKGIGFRSTAQKVDIVVILLMGDVPDRSMFALEDTRKILVPYFRLTQAVRTGDLSLFTSVATRFQDVFMRDGTMSLIQRLHQNVVKAGLRAINCSYSRISLADVAKKLGLGSSDEAACVSAKAIADGVIDAKINREGQYLESAWYTDMYSTAEPQEKLHKRIGFCLQLYADALKAMQFPDPSAHKARVETIDDIRRREEEELLADDDDDMMI